MSPRAATEEVVKIDMNEFRAKSPDPPIPLMIRV